MEAKRSRPRFSRFFGQKAVFAKALTHSRQNATIRRKSPFIATNVDQKDAFATRARFRVRAGPHCQSAPAPHLGPTTDPP
jgi:hypothetical protein